MPLVKLWNSLRGRSKEPSTEQESASSTRDAPAAKPSSKRRLFGGGPHSALCKQLKGLSVSSVLEISVGDGTRALAVLKALTKNSAEPMRYLAIDEFELGGGEIGLREFFCLLRENEIRPQLFPESLDYGLRRVANTVGAIDLVLIAAPTQQWQNPVTLQLLSRISHSTTAVFFDDGESWTRYAPGDSAAVRRAA